MTHRDIAQFADIPNVGPATIKDLRTIGIHSPKDLIGQDPYQLYVRLCQLTNSRHDPCTLDIFMAAVSYMDGGPAQKWWEFSAERKRLLS
ncbi:mitomycin resistance protein [Shewanella sp. SNU WT4]|uniref:helix-hairpin-helix domain-containing protein n=1 Tax=Shewanella sp. SNU WT4 TaxID=2590015 RepID=UPI00112CEEB9|nr:helix-hairpin-helix domain-containing protein [Shewanella sp. SNU WT4]QDF67231.1 mitomycin resistance protein [Shewanella sp. SNU WT4]